VGTIGVLGPTRMNYPNAIAAVGVVSQRLGLALREAN
jgi:transcriptional regulator of heat shock response